MLQKLEWEPKNLPISSAWRVFSPFEKRGWASCLFLFSKHRENLFFLHSSHVTWTLQFVCLRHSVWLSSCCWGVKIGGWEPHRHYLIFKWVWSSVSDPKYFVCIFKTKLTKMNTKNWQYSAIWRNELLIHAKT